MRLSDFIVHTVSSSDIKECCSYGPSYKEHLDGSLHCQVKFFICIGLHYCQGNVVRAKCDAEGFIFVKQMTITVSCKIIQTFPT